MSIPDSFAPYVLIFLILCIALISYFVYRFLQFIRQLIYRLTHRRPKAYHIIGEVSASIQRDREWTEEVEGEDKALLIEATQAEMTDEESAEEEPYVGEQPPGPLQELTEREKEVAQLALEQKRNKQIAKELHISVNTVQNHLSSIYRKLHLESRSELKYIPRHMLY